MEYVKQIFTDLFTKADPSVQLIILSGLLIGVGGLIYWNIHTTFKVRELKIVRDEMRLQLRAKEDAIVKFEVKLADAYALGNQFQVENQRLIEERGGFIQKIADHEKDLDQTKLKLDHSEIDLKALQQRFDDIQKIDADVWLGSVSEGNVSPRFLPRNERITRFVAFLNLKGGVGKTTLVANLAGAYATGITGNKLRLLVIDLDYQGTLGNMCVATDFILHLRKTKKTAEALLSDENVSKESCLILEPLMGPFEGTDKRSKAIVADEALDHIDFRQQARFAIERSEVRFNYRRILHDPFVLNSFDFVFFDCPPRLTTSAINALSAADFIVVPTSLHPNDVDAVPRTLRWLEKLQALDNFQARLAAVILNRTYRKGTIKDGLTKDEKQLLSILENSTHKFLPTGNAIISSLIPNSPEIARYAGGSVPLGTTSEGHEIYKGVACELHERMRG